MRRGRSRRCSIRVAARSPEYDEFVDAAGNVRPSWVELAECVGERGRGGLEQLRTVVRSLVDNDGITYIQVDTNGNAVTNGDGAAAPGPWHLDALPLLISAADWDTLEAGLVQRSRLLDTVLADFYGPRRSVTSGVFPAQLLFAHPGYIRAARGIEMPGRHQLFMHAATSARAVPGPSSSMPTGRRRRRAQVTRWRTVGSSRTPSPICTSGSGHAPRRRGRRRCGWRSSTPHPSPPRSRWWWCSAPASTPRPRSIRPIWPACWVSRWWRAPTWWCVTESCGCGHWAPSNGWTWCCAEWTPTTPTRWIYVPTRDWGSSGWSRCCAGER